MALFLIIEATGYSTVNQLREEVWIRLQKTHLIWVINDPKTYFLLHCISILATDFLKIHLAVKLDSTGKFT